MTAPRLLLATANPKKRKELQELCAGRFEVVTLDDVGLSHIDVVEDAPDFVGNATKKALEVRDALVQTGDTRGVRVVVADDSGLCVDALDGHPGVRSARFASDAGYVASGVARDDKDAANNRLLLTLLEVIPPERRGAWFISVVVGAPIDGGTPTVCEGRVHGRIARDLHGAGGFGYDPLFIIDDADDRTGAPALKGRRMAELSADEKHGISHRGRAMRALLEALSPQT